MSKVSEALMKKVMQVQGSSELLLEKTQDWQLIKAYLSNRLATEDFLNERQKKKLKRYEFVYNQLVSGKYTEADIVGQLMKLHGSKSTQAYEDISCTKEIFNTVMNINKQFEINLQLQINRNMMRKAEELNDYRSVAALEKNRAMLLKLLPDQEENPAELFEGHQLEAVFDPRLLGAPDVDIKEVLKLINEKRKVKIDYDKLITDIPFEDLTNEETAPL